MKYQVIKAFNDLGRARNVGDIIEVDGKRAGKLIQYRLIGLVKEKAIKVVEVEKAVSVEPEEVKIEVEDVKPKAKPKPRARKKK